MKDKKKPEVFVTQSEKDEHGRDYHYPEAEFVMVRGEKIHLWANGLHFVEDEDGAVEPDQYYMTQDPGMGVFISQVESVDSDEGTVITRHHFHWNDGEISFPDYTEEPTEGQITGDYDRAMGDTSQTRFLKLAE